MNGFPRQAWVLAALLLAVVYLLIGRLFALPVDHVHGWRLAAWAASGVAYAAHIAFEHFRLHNSPRVTALHVAAGVALGAFALAVAGVIHRASTGSPIGPEWLLAMAVWPAVTGLPAFLGALVAGAILPRLSRSAER